MRNSLHNFFFIFIFKLNAWINFGIQAFNPDPREELGQGHLESMNNREVLSHPKIF